MKLQATNDRETRTRLFAQDVPESVISKVIDGESISDVQLARLTAQQMSAVREAQLTVSGNRLGAGAGTACAGGFSIVIMIMSFVGGLVGWLLIMRKRVLQCTRCGAIVAAS